MNRVILMGRLARDPEVRYTQGESSQAVARYTLATDRLSSNDDNAADFISCVAFGKSAEFAEKFLHKGTKIAIEGRIRTGSYTNKEGNKVYTTDVVVDRHEFCEGRSAAPETAAPSQTSQDGFMNVPDGIDEELPFG